MIQVQKSKKVYNPKLSAVVQLIHVTGAQEFIEGENSLGIRVVGEGYVEKVMGSKGWGGFG